MKKYISLLLAAVLFSTGVLVPAFAHAAPTTVGSSSFIPSGNGQILSDVGDMTTTGLQYPLTQIASGCAVPNSTEQHNVFYVDAVHGSVSGDGSAAHPWLSLSTVLSNDVATSRFEKQYIATSTNIEVPINVNAPVHAGDTILLMNGNYGDINIWGNNTDFITIAAAPGQAPVLSSLAVHASAKWIFQGLKVQSSANGYGALILVSPGYFGPVNNIIVDHNNVSSADSTTGWSVADWLAKGRWGGIETDEGTRLYRVSNCVTITNNDIYNIRFGASASIDNSLFANNTINNFGEDALDYDANNILIQGNTITNSLNLQDGNHPDGMQGQIGRLSTSTPTDGYTNVTINGNTIIRQTQPNPLSGGLQGIDGFDMNWSNLTVTNNVVITDDYQGISYASVHGGLIANNTLLYDGSNVGSSESPSPSTTSWITVGSLTHEGTPSNAVVVRNNIGTNIVQGTSDATFENNVASAQVDLVSTTTGKEVYNSKAGIYGMQNVIDKNLDSEFLSFNTTTMKYDMHLSPSSSSYQFGAYASAYPNPVWIASSSPATTTPPVATTTPPVATSTPPVVVGSTISVSNDASLAAAMKIVKAGQTISLATGTYTLPKFLSMQFTSPVTITSANPNKPAVLVGLGVANSSDLTFTNLELTTVGSTDPYYAFRMQNSQNITFTHLNVHGNPAVAPALQITGFYIVDSNNVTITDSQFSYNAAITANEDTNINISDNGFDYMNKGGIEMGGSSDVTLDDNNFTNFFESRGTHADAIQIYTAGTTNIAHDITADGNLFYRGAGYVAQGIFIQDEGGVLPYRNVTINGNTIIGAQWNSILQRGITGNLAVNNNIVATWPGIDIEGAGTPAFATSTTPLVTTDFTGWIFLRSDLTGVNVTETGNEAQGYPTLVAGSGLVAPSGNTILGKVTDNGDALLHAWALAHPQDLGFLSKDLSTYVQQAATTPPATTTPPVATSTPPVATSTPPTGSTNTGLQFPITQVASGCALPSTTTLHNTWYVDAVNGSASGDGSKAHPWQSLTSVLATQVNDSQYPFKKPFVPGGPLNPVNTTGLVKPGDTILLMSGNYGAISISGVNSNFITIAAVPGQTPVFSSLYMTGATDWILQGIKVQSLASGYTPLVDFASNTTGNYTTGPINNIIFDHNTVSSADDASSWSAAQWLANARWGGISTYDAGGTPQYSGCLSETNNQISNIRFGVSLNIDHSLFANNTINNFGDDALDYDANNLLIQGNTLTNAINVGDENHSDAMQGQIGREGTSTTAGYTNDTINGNTIIRQTIANNPLAGGLQGIDGFDSNWTNLTVTNNVVVTDDYQGIGFGSVHNGLIANNTLLYDHSATDNPPSNDTSTYTWITVGSTTHEGLPSNNVTIKNNIAPSVVQGTLADTLTNNISQYQFVFIDPTTGAVTYPKANGTYPGGNIVDKSLYSGFTQYDTQNKRYDLHPLSTSPFFEFGAYGSMYPNPVWIATSSPATTTPPVASSSPSSNVTVSTTAALLAALNAAHNGDTILLAPGTYSSLDIKNYKSPGMVTITSEDTNNPAIVSAIKIENSSGITFKDVTFYTTLSNNPAGSGAPYPFSITTSSQIILNGIQMHGSLDNNPQDDVNGLLIEGSSNITVENSTFQQLYNGIIEGANTNVSLTNNVFHDIRSDGIDNSGTSELTISGNTFTDFFPYGAVGTTGDHADAIQVWTSNTTADASNISITNNTYIRGTGAAIQGIFVTDQVGLQYQNVTITGNVVVGSSYNAITLSSSNNSTVSNNLVGGYMDPAPSNYIRAQNNVNLGFDNNIAPTYFIDSTDAFASHANDLSTGLVSPVTLQPTATASSILASLSVTSPHLQVKSGATVTGNVLADDQGPSLYLADISVGAARQKQIATTTTPSIYQGGYGTLTISPTGVFSYTAKAGVATGKVFDDLFPLTVADSVGADYPTTLDFTVTALGTTATSTPPIATTTPPGNIPVMPVKLPPIISTTTPIIATSTPVRLPVGPTLPIASTTPVNNGGGSTNIPVTTIVPPPSKPAPLPVPTVTMTTGGYALQGKSGTVTWTSTNATMCVGSDPDNANSAFNGPQLPDGTFIQTDMTAGQHFFLTCTGTGGKGSAYVWIGVTVPPPTIIYPTVTLTQSATYVRPGSSMTVTWSSTNAASCVGQNTDNTSSAFNGSLPLSGSFVQTDITSGEHFFVTCTSSSKGVGKQYVYVGVSSSAAATATTTLANPTNGVGKLIIASSTNQALTGAAYNALNGLASVLGQLGELIRHL